MTEKDNILNELNELKSSLAIPIAGNVYAVPAGYFDDLAQSVLKRIKALETNDAKVELGYLSPLLGSMTKEMPYAVPADYFNRLANVVSSIPQTSHHQQTAQEELETMSPLLSRLKKEMPYKVPDGYFENTTDFITTVNNKPAVKVVSFSRRSWVRYAAAAVVTGIIALSGFLIFNKPQSVEPGSKVLVKFTKDVNKMDEAQKDNLIDFIDAGLQGDESAQTNAANEKEIKELLKGVSDKELLDLNQQSEDLESVLMIN